MSRVTIQEASRLLDVSEQYLRFALRQDRFPFGNAVKGETGRWTYYIHRGRLEKYIGGNDGES